MLGRGGLIWAAVSAIWRVLGRQAKIAGTRRTVAAGFFLGGDLIVSRCDALLLPAVDLVICPGDPALAQRDGRRELSGLYKPPNVLPGVGNAPLRPKLTVA